MKQYELDGLIIAIDPQAKYVAVDEDGQIFSWCTKPKPDIDGWGNFDNSEICDYIGEYPIRENGFVPNWKELCFAVEELMEVANASV